MVLENQVPGIKVAVGTYPDVIADDARAIEPAVDDRAGTDEDAVTYLERLPMIHANPVVDPKPVTASPDHGSPEDSTHQSGKSVAPVTEAIKNPSELLDAVLVAKVPGKL
jgi:hypothetical protein